VVGVGAVVLHEDRVLLIRRGKEPLRGRWLIPGGTVELGETLEEAVVREVHEETGVAVRPRDVVLVFDRILREEGRVVYHYVIVDYACDYVDGTPRAGSDADDAAFVAESDLARYDVPEQALALVRRAFELKRLAPAPEDE
jgi:ADP-ribose pyrophosphatase YjhB (NUDIX family)